MRLIDHEVGMGQATSYDLAAASGRLLGRLSQRMTQIIGPAGVEAIFSRAIKIRKAEFPYLDGLNALESDSIEQSLRDRLQELEPHVIRSTSVILMATFSGLLATVIGERLTWSIIRDLWPDTLRPQVEPLEANE